MSAQVADRPSILLYYKVVIIIIIGHKDEKNFMIRELMDACNGVRPTPWLVKRLVLSSLSRSYTILPLVHCEEAFQVNLPNAPHSEYCFKHSVVHFDCLKPFTGVLQSSMRHKPVNGQSYSSSLCLTITLKLLHMETVKRKMINSKQTQCLLAIMHTSCFTDYAYH